MAAQLKEITTQYHTFVENQVLTHTQLNEFITYFEDQDRLSRILLSGVGIACGFKVSFNPGTSTITLGNGTGVTTDGDLLTLKSKVPESPLKKLISDSVSYKWFRKFEDQLAGYSFFRRLEDVDGTATDVLLHMWEVLPEETENSQELSEMADLNNMVVLLYLESFPLEGDLCTAKDCDNQGIEQVNRLRVLLVSKEDAAFIAGLDPVFSRHDVTDTVLHLPDPKMKRVILTPNNTTAYTELKRAYHSALNSSGLIENLGNGITEIVNRFRDILNLDITETRLNSMLAKLKNITGFQPYSVPFNVQYRYDLVLDLLDTYDEIKSHLLNLKQVCLPDITAFPKHLMLGAMDEVSHEPKHFRHSFYRSPVLNSHTDSQNYIRSLVYRFFTMTDQFSTSAGEVKITPSVQSIPLTRKAIPFYYNVNQFLLNVWDHQKTVRFNQKNNLSYHTSHLSPVEQVQDPLAYNHDFSDFYRIEGHQGQNYKDVLEEIDTLKESYSLAFDVKALSVNINTETLNIDDYECEFEDLNVLLKAWTAEQDCVLAEVSEFLSGFRTDVPGKNFREGKFDATRNMLLMNKSGIMDETSELKEFTNRMKRGLMGNMNVDYSDYDVKAGSTVNDNLVTEDNSLGKDFQVVLNENKGGSAAELIFNTHRLIDAKVETEEWTNAPEIKDLVIDQSIEVMAFAHILTQRMPGLLLDVNLERVDAYQLSLKELCQRVEVMKEKYQSVQLTSALKSVMGVLITQLSSICCSGKKLQILLKEINARKAKILARLQFAKFVEQHPGVEHKAGVQAGGTFILVYISKEKVRTELVKEESIRGKEKAGNNRLKVLYGSGYKANEKDFNSRTEAELLSDDKFVRDVMNRDIHVTDLANNTVVADFALPYMCCSDCAPVNFIVQKPPVSLRLDKDHFCLGQDKSPLLFEVSPTDGVIKSDPEIDGLTLEGNKLKIDEASFDESYLRKPIRFTVNQQVTDVELMVSKTLEVDFTYKQSEKDEAKVTFIPDGDLDGASLQWDFGDGNTSDEKTPVYRYILPVNEANKVTVKLIVTASNGVCKASVEQELSFKLPKTKVTLEPTKFCSNDNQSYPFKITPAGADPTIKGKGVVQDNNGNNAFVPQTAGAGTFKFTVDGKDAGIEVVVNEAPKAVFTHNQVGNKLILKNTSTGADAYKWSVNGKTVEHLAIKNLELDVTPNTPTWRVGLEAISETCGSDKTETITIQTKFVDEQTDNCLSETAQLIMTDARTLSEKTIPEVEELDATRKETAILYERVLNKAKDFLEGKQNEALHGMFSKLFNNTAKQIVALSRGDSIVNLKNMKDIFRLQLELYYNILGCQQPEVIEASSDPLNPVFDTILRLLKTLKKNEIFLPKTLNVFMKSYSVKVKDNQLLSEHMAFISKNKLIIFG